MGIKEDANPFVFVKGYSARLLPTQIFCGRCSKCGKKVFSTGYNGKPAKLVFIHYSCENIADLEVAISNIIPVPVYSQK